MDKTLESVAYLYMNYCKYVVYFKTRCCNTSNFTLAATASIPQGFFSCCRPFALPYFGFVVVVCNSVKNGNFILIKDLIAPVKCYRQ